MQSMLADPEHLEKMQRVSVVIPARNAAGTLSETLDTLLSQTYPHWEAIIVDDGSSDGTLALAQRSAAQDRRIRCIRSDHAGVSAARNAGIRAARYDWLLFLDADDWLKPQFLERMTGVLDAQPDLDAVHCGWARLTPDGRSIEEHAGSGEGDLSSYFRAACYFAIHACLVRREIVVSIGGFDVSLHTCEDWDLWVNVTRRGARFGVVPDILALYRTRPDSASFNVKYLIGDAYRVLERSHAPGAKPGDIPDDAGQMWELLVRRKYLFFFWCAGLLIGSWKDACPLLRELPQEPYPGLDPREIANHLFHAILLPDCQTRQAAVEFWSRMVPGLQAFLAAFEAQTQTTFLAETVIHRLLRTILTESADIRPLSIGLARAVCIDVWEPIPEMTLPPLTERLFCAVTMGGSKLGVLELPVFGGRVSSYVLADAVAAEFAWTILERFFQGTIYATFRTESTAGGLSVWRSDVLLSNALPQEQDALARHLHAQAGWLIFLQEVWDRPDKPLDWFYDPQAEVAGVPTIRADDGWLPVDVCDTLCDVECPDERLQVPFSVGGAQIGVAAVPVQEGRVSAAQIRSTLIRSAGFELCRAAVREGLLGQRFDEPGNLHQRLVSQRAARPPAENSMFEQFDVGLPEGLELADGWQSAALYAMGTLHRAILFPRRMCLEIDSSASRRVIFPASAFEDLVDSAAVVDEKPIRMRAPAGQPVPLIYAPELLLRAPEVQSQAGPVPRVDGVSVNHAPMRFGREVFEGLFASRPDPWNYTSAYEQIKYEQTLSLLPRAPIRNALELACAEGHFTIQLAPRVGHLIAADISAVALNRAAHRCAEFQHIRYLLLDLLHDPLPGSFDLIVCSEVLYYVGNRAALEAVAQKLANALRPGGHLLMAHAHLVIDEPEKPGFNWDHPFGARTIHEVFEARADLQLAGELRTPLYRIQLFQKRRGGLFSWPGKREPNIIRLERQPALPPPGADIQVLWDGGSPERSEARQAIVTDRLPILLYHRVAPLGLQSLQRYRITPDQFEQQLRYLHDCGYHSVTIEEWHAAMMEHRPLSGRLVMLTFDDGYRDFKEYAWPLLKRFGFSALVFLVAGEIGGHNRWDHNTGDLIPLLSWDEIFTLSASGIQFGSHSTTHPMLTAISPADVVREAIRSRSILERGLGKPIRSIAYPHGQVDPVVRHLVGGCGYLYGFTCRNGRSSLWDNLLQLPRIEVSGLESFADFVRKLS